MIEIQNGCLKHPTQANTWIYTYVDIYAHKDYQEPLEVDSTDVTIVFTSDPGVKPAIGDFIEAGRLVKRTTPKVNNDWRMWKDKEY